MTRSSTLQASAPEHGMRPRGRRRYRRVATLGIVGAALLTALPVTAQQARIVYLEGEVALIAGAAASPRPAQIGDALAPQSVLVLGGDGMVEIEAGPRPLLLVGPGRYPVRGVVTEERPAASPRTRGPRLRVFIDPVQRPEATVAGVRGDYGGESTWGGGGLTAELVAAADDARRDGELQRAAALYEEALLYGPDPAVSLRLAAVRLESDDAAGAREALPTEVPEPFYPELVGLTVAAGLALDSTDEVAAFLADVAWNRLPRDARGRLRLLQAELLRDSGRAAEADAVLEALAAAAPESGAGRAASRMLAAERERR